MTRLSKYIPAIEENYLNNISSYVPEEEGDTDDDDIEMVETLEDAAEWLGVWEDIED